MDQHPTVRAGCLPRNPAEVGLLAEIAQIADLKRRAGCADSHNFEAFLLSSGEFFAPRLLPKNVKTGEMRGCFMNAFRLAQPGDEFVYVEGIARAVIPVHHAWVATPDGIAIDPTWMSPKAPRIDVRFEDFAYFGARVSYRELLARAHKTGVYGYFDAGVGFLPRESIADTDAGRQG